MHVVAVTKVGRLFAWGGCWYGCLGHNNNSFNKLRPKRVEHGGFVELFIVCASAGCYRSAAINSSGLVPIFCFSTILDIATLQFILNPCLRCYLSNGPFDMMQLILSGI
jgi:hypothetical protein